MCGQAVEAALAEARAASDEISTAQQAIIAAAHRRQQAILRAAEAGHSVRNIATLLNCSPSVIQTALRAARTVR